MANSPWAVQAERAPVEAKCCVVRQLDLLEEILSLDITAASSEYLLWTNRRPSHPVIGHITSASSNARVTASAERMASMTIEVEI